MSTTKSPRSQIHDGYATIRSRGSLNRSRSRLERKPLKFENNLQETIYDSVCKTAPVSTFKPEYDVLPALKSPQYITELAYSRPESKISLYQRPTSPLRAVTPTQPPSAPVPAPPESPIYANWQNFSTFKKPPTPETEDVHKPTFKKPPISYRKSFSVRERPIIRDYGVNGSNTITTSSSDLSEISSTESYGRIHKNASIELIHLTDSGYFAPTRINHRYATLGHQPRNKLQQKYVGKSTGSLNECILDHNDILDCKIGSQNTLRPKPKIPWWELAIKKENRQSCPPFQQVLALKFLIKIQNHKF